MPFRDIVGQDHPVRLLRQAVRAGRASHAYAFVGPAGTGRRAVALAFAQALLCARPEQGDACGACEPCRRVAAGLHPDVSVIEPAGDAMKIEQIRDLKHTAQFPPYEGAWRVFILDHAEAMTTEAQNSLLKLLEEPPPAVVLILVAESTASLLPTVVSRAQLVRFALVPAAEIERALAERGVEPGRARFLAALAAGRVASALRWAAEGEAFEARDDALRLVTVAEGGDVIARLGLAEELAKQRDRLPEILDLALLWYRDALVWHETRDRSLLINQDRRDEVERLAAAGSHALRRRIEAVEDAKAALRRNINTRLALEAMLLASDPVPTP